MTAAARVLVEKQLAQFELRRVLGEGGTGTVYDAYDGDRRVALKVLREDLALSPREMQRFVDEANRMVRVDHPALVKLDSAGVLPDGRPYLAMQFLDGETLATRLLRGPLEPAEAVRVFGVLARAVGALHDAGFIHRDIKPENIVLVEREEGLFPVLLDFGIAREIDGGPSTTTVSGGVRGTPAYMAPERFFGAPASVRSDIYELAVTLHMMVVGKLPWGGIESVSERLAPRSPSDFGAPVPSDLARAILRAISTRPEVRPESALAFAEEIERAWENRDAPPAVGAVTEDVPMRSDRPPDPHLAALVDTGPSMRDARGRTSTMRPSEVPPPLSMGWRIASVVGAVVVIVGAVWLGTRLARPDAQPSTQAPPTAPATQLATSPSMAVEAALAATATSTAEARDPAASPSTSASSRRTRLPASSGRPNDVSSPTPSATAQTQAPVPSTKPSAGDPFLEDRR